MDEKDGAAGICSKSYSPAQTILFARVLLLSLQKR